MSAAVLEFLTSARGIALFVLLCAPLTGVITEKLLHFLMTKVEKAAWWPQAQAPQKQMLINFGHPEEKLGEFEIRAGFAYILAIVGDHFLAGCLTVPVVHYGWSEAGVWGQVLFVVGVLMDVSFDVYDEFRLIVNAFAYESLGKKIFGTGECPKPSFIVIGVLHHPLAMIMACPMVIYYPSHRAFHLIASALLMAAGVCFLSGQYKFTLDVTKRGDLLQFKAIVFVQLVSTLVARLFVWFPQVFVLLSTFYDEGNMTFLCVGCFSVLLMSLFNVIMVLDAISAAVKWLPRTQETAKEEALEEVTQSKKKLAPVQKDVCCVEAPEACKKASKRRSKASGRRRKQQQRLRAL